MTTRRPAATRRRSAPVARASAGAPGRILAGIVLFAAAAALYGVSASDAFAVEPASVEVRGARWTNEADLRAVLGLGDERPNLFRLRTNELVERLRTLPAVAAADVRAVLPDRLVIEVRERTPILVWQVGERRYLVDVDGVLFAQLADAADAAGGAGAAGAGAGGAAAAGAAGAGATAGVGAAGSDGLPVIVDRREPSAGLRVGASLEPVDLAVARNVGAITPLDIDSSARSLQIEIDPEIGWVVDAQPESWRAVFGLYTPTLRTADIVPRQVQCLEQLLSSREREVETVYLSPLGDRCGTFVARES